ncbi:hypothetical protein Vretimale_11527 [Volvox reticuliferus]|uniref:Uncharacterized protein n=1 Tax=Volvox reticuliferus TaxID=1737510 RepID=A0A8J4CPW7_9CHLO|nr:hypothetical protein Vretifemale_14919 [Volvox reticuliferus]GIM07360.1 hypothetical protein Vretimale_11527 [Volvox reticuliferus]
MANELGIPLKPIRPNIHYRTGDIQKEDFDSDIIRNQDECARGLKMRARRAVGAARGVVSIVRACGSRIAFRYRNRAAYPRRCAAPPAVFITAPIRPLSAMSLRQLDALRANLEAEEAGLMESLRELWHHLAVGSHLQPAFVDPDRLAHVTRLLLAGDTDAVERDPDNDEVSGAATMQLTSQRLEAALVEVHAHMQAVCAERRRRKGLQPMEARTSEEAAAAAVAHGAGPISHRRGTVSRSVGTHAVAAAFGERAKRVLSFTTGRASSGGSGMVTRLTSAPSCAAIARGGRAHGRSADETPKRKLSSLSSLSQVFVDDRDDSPEGVGSPRPKPTGRWRGRLIRRSESTSLQVPTSQPAGEGDEAEGRCILDLGYTQLPTHD